MPVNHTEYNAVVW